MSEKTEPSTSTAPAYEDVSTAPIVYFDVAACHGAMGGVVQIEVAARILVPDPKNASVSIKFSPTGRLRCTRKAAQALINSLETAVKMLEQSQNEPTAASKLN